MLISSVWRGLGRSYFIVGLLAGGLVAATLVCLVGAVVVRSWLPEVSREGVLAVVIVVITAASPLLLRLRYAQNRRQVPEAVRNLGPRAGAFQFGFEMGTGSRTFMPTTMPYVVLTGLLLVVQLPTALAVGLGFGAGRALVPLLRSHDNDDLEWSASFDRWARTIWLGTTSCGLVSLAVVSLVGSQ